MIPSEYFLDQYARDRRQQVMQTACWAWQTEDKPDVPSLAAHVRQLISHGLKGRLFRRHGFPHLPEGQLTRWQS